MKKKILLLIVFTLVTVLSTGTLLAQGKPHTTGNAKQKKSPPFLITGKMPHMTKQVMQAWDNPEFNLSEEQKDKLLIVRKQTMTAAKKLGRQITPLEQQVADGIMAEKTPQELAPLVREIADMKTEATMVHLRCIANTREILSDEQEDFLKKQ